MKLSQSLVVLFGGLTAAQSSFNPLRPPAIPLAVRSPYMSTWQQAGSDGGNGGYLAGQWPTFWHGAVTGWTGMIRVDGNTYTWMGAPDSNKIYATQTDFTYTSTRSTFTFQVERLVEITVEFLSPVTPKDLLRSSLPYTYMDVSVKSIDGKQHNVQIYTDISAEWVAGDRDAIAQWSYGNIAGDAQAAAPTDFATTESSTTTTAQATVFGTRTDYIVPSAIIYTDFPTLALGQGFKPDLTSILAEATSIAANVARDTDSSSAGIVFHQVFRANQLEFSESNEQAEWGNWYYATKNTSGLAFQSGEDTVVRGNFVKNGALPNTQDTKFRPINQAYPVFAYSVDLGQVGSNPQSTLFQLSLHQKNCVRFENQLNVIADLPCMWTNYFSTDQAALSFFYNDFNTGSSMATSFDNQIANDSKAAGGQDYLSLTSLATRQAFAAIELTNTPSSPYVFMKEISSDGNVNTVDVIFPFHPIAVYTNPNILKWLLDPLFINQEAGNWPKQYSIHDIGNAFPNATGHNDGNDEDQPLEECGDMLIMTLAYAQRANDTAYLKQHYNILKQWTGFLVQEALIPMNQISTDDFAGPAANQTNLALKGIIGIGAMAQISMLTGNLADNKNYTSIAKDYIVKWQQYGTDSSANPPHTEFNYNNASSYSLLYNLFGDKELGLGLVPQSVYDMQSSFYPSKLGTYGVPLDSRHTYTKNDWQMFCAAIASQTTKTQFISTIAKWLSETTTNFAFTDIYDTITGDYAGIYFVARPVVGGMFSLLALNSAPASS